MSSKSEERENLINYIKVKIKEYRIDYGISFFIKKHTLIKAFDLMIYNKYL